MRAQPTKAEQKLWWHLRHTLRVRDTHFRRQVQLGRYIVDFASHKNRLVIEVDGGQHSENIEIDAIRTKFLEAKGYLVLRFWNNDVIENIDGVLETIQKSLVIPPTPTPPHKGEGEN